MERYDYDFIVRSFSKKAYAHIAMAMFRSFIRAMMQIASS